MPNSLRLANPLQRRNQAVTFLFAFFAILLLLPMLRYSDLKRRYEKPRLIGLTKAEARRLLGAPTNQWADGDVWLYQYGMDPEASLEFQQERVVRVWSALEDGFVPGR